VLSEEKPVAAVRLYCRIWLECGTSCRV